MHTDELPASQRLSRTFIGTFIAVVLLLQASVIVFSYGTRLYPFLGYAMYTRAHGEGEMLAVELPIYARLRSGREVRVRPDDVGMNFWKLHRVAERILAGREEETRTLFALYESRTRQAVQAFRIMSYPAVISRRGIEPAASKILALVERPTP